MGAKSLKKHKTHPDLVQDHGKLLAAMRGTVVAAFDDGALRQTFDRFGGLDPRDLPLDERCAAVKTMAFVLRCHGLNRGHAQEDAAGELEKFDTAPYKNEIAVLNAFTAALDYSDYFRTWINVRRRAFVERLDQSRPYSRLCREWCEVAHADEGEPEILAKILENVLALQAKTYSEGAIPFAAPRISFVDGARESKVLGQVMIDSEKLANGELPDVEISLPLLNDMKPDRALHVSHHEEVHRLMAELASAAMRGTIDRKNPLYHDAQIEAARARAGAIINCAIYEAYAAQPSERVCREQQRRFELQFINPVIR